MVKTGRGDAGIFHGLEAEDFVRFVFHPDVTTVEFVGCLLRKYFDHGTEFSQIYRAGDHLVGTYSVFRLFAGLARAARIDWKLMVKKVSKIMNAPAAAKIPMPISMR